MCSGFQRLKRFMMAAALVGAADQAQLVLAQVQNTVTLPDAQVASNVLQALASNVKLADQTISTTAIAGEVTLSGSVHDEATRVLAEQVVARTAGVTKVIDELTVAGEAAGTATLPEQSSGSSAVPRRDANAGSPSHSQDGSNPDLQSDGTLAQPESQPAQVRTPGANESQGEASRNDGKLPRVTRGQDDPLAAGDSGYGRYGDGRDGASDGTRTTYPQPRPYARPPYPGQAGQSSPRSAEGYSDRRQQWSQVEGRLVVVPAGTSVRVRTNQEIDSRNTPVGMTFTGVVLSDVVVDGLVAIPRGAEAQGVVNEVRQAGAFRGQGELALQLTAVTLGGRVYSLSSNTWGHLGADKTGRTVGSAVGLGVAGAIIGGAAGGGAGAAIGAAVGGVTGVGVSAASPGGQAYIPAEAVLRFQLTQPVQLTTVSRAELSRLAASLPYPQRRSIGVPPPPPYAYGPEPSPYAPPRYYRSYSY